MISVVEMGRRVPRLLRDSGVVGRELHPPKSTARMLDEEQDMDPLEQEGLDREEVARDDAVSFLAGTDAR